MENKKEGKELKDDLSKLAKNAGISGVGGIIGNAIAYTSNVLVTRRIGLAPFGVYVLASTILRIVGIFSVLGLDWGLIRFISLYQGRGDRARVKGVILFATKVAGLISLFFFSLLFLTSNFISIQIFHNPDLSPALQILSISLPFTTLMTVWLGGIQGFQLIKYRVYVEKLFQPLSRLLFLILLFILGMKLFGVLIALLLSAIIGSIFAFCYLDKIFPFRQNQLIPIYEKKEILAFSLAVSLNSFFYYVSRWIGIFMLGYFATSKDVGIYGAVDRVIPLINLPLVALDSIFPPMISELYGKKDYSKLESLYKVETKWAISLGLPFFLVLSIFARPIMSIFGAEFGEGATVLIILSAAQMIIVCVGSQGQVLIMTGHQNLTLINNVFFAVINIVLNYFLIPKYGILGAAVSGLICSAAITLIEVGQVYYLFRMHPFRSDLVKPLAAAVIVSCLTLFLNRLGFLNLSQMNIFLFGICVAIFMGLYFLLIIALKLSDEDRFVTDVILKRFLWQGKQKP